MNLSVLGGFTLAGLIIAYSLGDGVVNQQIIFSKHAAAIVLGGTLAAALIAARFGFLWQMAKVFLDTLTGRRRAQLYATLEEIVRIAQSVYGGKPVGDAARTAKNPFLRELLSLSEQAGLDEGDFETVVSMRLQQQNERYKRNAYLFKTIGKFPPAFGLIGTTIGMIALLQGLGQPDAFERIGPSMSVALVATFYGLVLANFVLIPVGENLHLASEEDLVMRRIVADGVMLIRRQKHPLLVQEVLISYLAPSERSEVKGLANAAA